MRQSAEDKRGLDTALTARTVVLTLAACDTFIRTWPSCLTGRCAFRLATSEEDMLHEQW